MIRRSPPRKVTYFEPVPLRLARNTIIASTLDVGRRFRCTMRINCGELDPSAVIRPVRGEWHPRMPEWLDEDDRAGRNAHLSARCTDDRRVSRGRRQIKQNSEAHAPAQSPLSGSGMTRPVAPAHADGSRFAAMDQAAASRARHPSAGRSPLAARNQVRRLPHACAPRWRRGAPLDQHWARLDAQISGSRWAVSSLPARRAYLDGERGGIRPTASLR